MLTWWWHVVALSLHRKRACACSSSPASECGTGRYVASCYAWLSRPGRLGVGFWVSTASGLEFGFGFRIGFACLDGGPAPWVRQEVKLQILSCGSCLRTLNPKPQSLTSRPGPYPKHHPQSPLVHEPPIRASRSAILCSLLENVPAFASCKLRISLRLLPSQ